MIFGYPLAATTENWLHKCLFEILQSIHAHLDKGENLPVWPAIIPTEYLDRLKSRTGVRDRLDAYQKALVDLSRVEQHQILRALKNQNEIALLLSCQFECEAITDLPSSIREPVKNLFAFAFSLLTDFEIRDQHYEIIYNSVSHHICPFCGFEPFDAPGARREALDHYLPEHKYSFAAVNLRNLVPMGHKCNSGYKLAQDMLRREDGTRRKSFDPYNHPGTVKISLINSEPFAGEVGNTGEPLPKWKVEFSPNSEESTTWNDVFDIETRYKRDVLDEAFNNWLLGFRYWCRDPRKTLPGSADEWVESIEGYAMYHEALGLCDRAFLKAAVFRMLHTHCKNGDQRLLNFIKNVVTM